MACPGPSFFKRTLFLVVLCALLSSVTISESQAPGSGSEWDNNITNMTNGTILCPAQAQGDNVECVDLPAVCLMCPNFTENCTYGDDVEVTCQPLEDVNCTVRTKYSSLTPRPHPGLIVTLSGVVTG